MGLAEDLSNVTLDGRYRLTRLLGAGGMGQVYEGMHEMLDRKVAVKVLLPRYAYEAKFRERFLREAKAASKVRHPNVVQILDFGETPNGSVYFAMEFLDGRDMQSMLREEGRFSWSRARHMLLQITSALGAAHERNIIHRDIKPANFFIINARGHREFIKVLDFGIAKITAAPDDADNSAKSLTGTGEVFGTAKYMAPEQAYGYSNDPRVDIYSVGVVAYQMLTGQVPFTGVSTFDIISRHVTTPPQPPRQLNPEIPPEVEAVILRSLAKRQEERFASMDEMEQALAAVPAEPGVPAHTLTSPSQSLSHSMAPAAPPFGAPRSPAAPSFAPAIPTTSLDDKLTAQQTIPQDMTPAPGAAHARPRPIPGVTPPGTPQGPGPGTRVVPTHLRAPSPMAPGALEHGAGRPAVPPGGPGPRPAPDAEASGPRASTSHGAPEDYVADGSSTSRMLRATDGGSATAPVAAGMAGTRASETDAHAVFSGVRGPKSLGRGLVLGLLVTMGVGGVLIASLWGLTSSDEATGSVAEAVDGAQPGSSDAEQPRVIIAKTPEPEAIDQGSGVGQTPSVETSPPASPSDTMMAQPDATPSETESEVEPATPSDPSDTPTEPQTTPDPETTHNSAARSPAEPAPLTDKRVRWRLARKLKKKCKDKASRSVTIELLVGSTGSVLTKDMRGVSPDLRVCLTQGLSDAKFPEGRTRKVSVTVDF